VDQPPIGFFVFSLRRSAHLGRLKKWWITGSTCFSSSAHVDQLTWSARGSSVNGHARSSPDLLDTLQVHRMVETPDDPGAPVDRQTPPATSPSISPSRHATAPEHIRLLTAALPRYFAYPDRSPERRRFIAREMMPHFSTQPDWDPSRVRIWFDNNRTKYLDGQSGAKIERTMRDDLLSLANRAQTQFQLIEDRLDDLTRQVDEMAESFEASLGRFTELQRVLADTRTRGAGLFEVAHGPPNIALSSEALKFQTARFFVETNQALRIADHPAFKKYARAIAPDLDIATSRELRQVIIEAADAFRTSLTAEAVGSPYLSLMIDGSTMAGRKWLGVCIATMKASMIWRVLEMDDFKAKTICDSLEKVVGELVDRHFILCSIVTDNAANEAAAVRELAERTQVPVVRIPCLSHTLNLAVQDCLTALVGKDVFVKDLRELYTALPTAFERDAFYGLESICPTRWLCFGKFVNTILRKSDLAIKAVDPKSPAGEVLRKYHFVQLDECFTVLNRLMTSSESRTSFLDGVWSRALGALSELKAAHLRRNRYALKFSETIRNRLTTTADIGQLILGFLITERGLAWSRALARDAESGVGFTQGSVLELIHPFVSHFVRVLDADSASVFRAFRIYLTELEWSVRQPSRELWDDVRKPSPSNTVRNRLAMTGLPPWLPFSCACRAARRRSSEAEADGSKGTYSRLA
jgi:hypothetical protein